MCSTNCIEDLELTSEGASQELEQLYENMSERVTKLKPGCERNSLYRSMLAIDIALTAIRRDRKGTIQENFDQAIRR